MSKELVIGSNRHETKVAVLEDDQLVEVYFQRSDEYSLAGSIHKGRVTRVLPGMQSAFVDLGLERDTFLYVSDFFEENEEFDTLPEDKPASSSRGDRGDRRPQRLHERGREDASPRENAEKTAELGQALPPVPASSDDGLETDEAEELTAAAATSAAGTVESRPLEHIRPNSGGRAEGDRGSGDRRGRRSRRRRGHGRDFPENKYAQPTHQSGPVGGNPAGSVTTAAPVDESENYTETENGEQPADVIVLPGESLAKYRTKPAGEVPVAPIRRRGERYYLLPKTNAPDSPIPEDTGEATEPALETPVPLPTEAAAESEVQAETEPSAVLEAVVAVHSPAPSELRLAPATETVSEEPEVHQPVDESIASEATELELTDRIFAHREDESVLAEDDKLAAVELDHPSEEAVVGTLESEELDVKDPSEALTDYDDLAQEFEEAIEGAELEEAASTETPEVKAAGEDQAQTASVREQGGRSMHRVSRRMRRRRGGRVGPRDAANAGAAPANGQSPVITEGGSGSAAAVATEPEAKTERRDAPETRTSERPERIMPSISELLKAGQEIIVQIAKEPLGQKGARITSHIALPGRYVVYMPSVAHLGVSRKVGSEEERMRLKRILQTHRVGTTGGFIIRTAGEGVTEDEIAADMKFLYSQWLDIRQKAEKKPAPALLHYDLGIVQRILRDQVTDEFKAIWVDNEDLYESVVTFMQRFQPALVNRVKMYTRSAPIFDAFNITQELEKALRPKVWLKSGGYIVINQTEALVAIDINTGKYVGKSNRLEDTIVKTNIEAVREIVRQIRLRDLGGIIVVDFIDMDERKNRQKVMQALEEAMATDKAPYKILQFNDFGLVAITRKRVKQSLERALCSPCPHCEGAGYIKSVQTVISEILIEAQKIARAIEGKDVMLRVHPDVAKELKSSTNKYLEELEEILGRPVLVKGDVALHHEKFDLG
ncbi:MAG TPA: Rne/Rng family ribonuclease [Bryobacteraceae bacterium]